MVCMWFVCGNFDVLNLFIIRHYLEWFFVGWRWSHIYHARVWSWSYSASRNHLEGGEQEEVDEFTDGEYTGPNQKAHGTSHLS